MEEIPEATSRIFKTLVAWRADPLKFLDFVKISDPHRGTIDFENWPHLVELFKLFLHETLILILKARRVGVSWLAAIYALWVIMTRPNAKVLMISVGEREAAELLGKVKFVYNNLPGYMREGITLSYNSTTMFGFKEMDSVAIALPCTATAGIGEGATVVIPDEYDKWGGIGQDPNIQRRNYSALRPTIDGGGQFIGISTTNKEKPDSFFKELYKGALAGKNKFVPRFLSWKERPGRDQQWYEDEQLGYPLELFEGDYPNTIEEALSPLAAHSFFDKEALLKLFDGVIEPIEDRGHGVYILHPPKVGVRYSAGADVGEGVGLDASALTIGGMIAGEIDVCAVIHNNEINTDLFAYESDKLLKDYFNPLLGAENNGLGLAYVNKMVELGYPSLYYGGKDRKKPGLTVGPTNRLTNLAELRDAITNRSVVTQYKPQVLELFDFLWKEVQQGQSVKPEGGKHDDLVMSLCHMYYMAKQQTFTNLEIKVAYPGSWKI